MKKKKLNVPRKCPGPDFKWKNSYESWILQQYFQNTKLPKDTPHHTTKSSTTKD